VQRVRECRHDCEDEAGEKQNLWEADAHADDRNCLELSPDAKVGRRIAAFTTLP
jgi:hypothetical protein